MTRDVRSYHSWHLASHNLGQLLDSLPFLYSSNTRYNHPTVRLDEEQKENLYARDFEKHSSQITGCSFMSFCETLASHTLQQGLKEGLDRVIDSNYLKVKIPKPPRRQTVPINASLIDMDTVGVSVKMSVSGESDAGTEGKLLFEMKESPGTQNACKVKAGVNVEFVALDVQSLEQMKAPSTSRVYQSHESKICALTKARSPKRSNDIVRSSTDYDIVSKKNGDGQRRPGYDPCSIYDITEFPGEINGELFTGTMRSAHASGHLLNADSCTVPQIPPEMVSFLEEPLLLVGPKLEWEGLVKARKISNAKRRKRRQQRLTPQELKKMTRVVIGYTLAFFLLVIVTFYIVYFV